MSAVSEVKALVAASAPRRGRIATVVNAILETAATLLLCGLTGLVLANAIGRYAFTRPLPWTEELAVNLLVWLAAVGIVLAGMRQALICCSIVADRLSSRTARRLAIFSAVLGSAVMAYISWLTWRYLGTFGGDLSPILKIPKGVGISGLFFATVGLTATLLVPLFRR